MEKVSIKLKCPKCGRNLSAQINKGLVFSNAKVRCSNKLCEYIGKGSEFTTDKKSGQNNSDDNTQGNDTEEVGTVPYSKSNNIATDMGQIRVVANNATYPLHFGKNSVGRLANTYKANMEPDIKIKTNDMKMSRCHARIDVKKSTHANGYVFHLQDTSLNGINLNDKDIPKNAVIVLSFGDQMVWGNTNVIFEAADGTQVGGDETLKN